MLKLPEPVPSWLISQSAGAVLSIQPVGGGCINHGARLLTTSGRSFFLKTNPEAPQDMFAREAEGLEALRGAAGPRFPQPFLHGPDFLLMEDLSPAARGPDFWPTLGRQLATLHLKTASRFGFDHDNYIGSTPQPNPWTADGWSFFAEQRLLFQSSLARRQSLLSRQDAARVERLASRLAELVPHQPASLLHGDLWGGNVLADERGAPALIDPAAYYGWAEAELAMTALFGGFSSSFYQAYQEVRPLEPGFEGRYPLYNLYHLLNHLNLFGEGYLGQVQSILNRYLQ